MVIHSRALQKDRDSGDGCCLCGFFVRLAEQAQPDSWEGRSNEHWVRVDTPPRPHWSIRTDDGVRQGLAP